MLETKPHELLASTVRVVQDSPPPRFEEKRASPKKTTPQPTYGKKTPKSIPRPSIDTGRGMRRETQSTTVSPLSMKSKRMNWSPVAVSPDEARSSRSSLYKPLPPAPPAPQLDFLKALGDSRRLR